MMLLMMTLHYKLHDDLIFSHNICRLVHGSTNQRYIHPLRMKVTFHSLYFMSYARDTKKKRKKENPEPKCMPCSPREYFLISDMICQEKNRFLFFLPFDSQLKVISQL